MFFTKKRKQISAFLISKIEELSDGRARILGRTCGRTFLVIVGRDYLRRCRPEIGGYFTQEKNGEQGFSIASVFEQQWKLHSIN